MLSTESGKSFRCSIFPIGISMFPRPVTRVGGRGRIPLEKILLYLKKSVGHGLKVLDIVQKIWAPLRKLFAPPGVPSWLRA